MSADATFASSGLTGEAPCSTRSPRISSSSAAEAGADRDPGVARVDPPGADLAFADLERPAHLQDPVEDLGQEQRVDDMSPDLHLFDHARVRLRGRGVALPPVVAVHGVGILPGLVVGRPPTPILAWIEISRNRRGTYDEPFWLPLPLGEGWGEGRRLTSDARNLERGFPGRAKPLTPALSQRERESDLAGAERVAKVPQGSTCNVAETSTGASPGRSVVIRKLRLRSPRMLPSAGL